MLQLSSYKKDFKATLLLALPIVVGQVGQIFVNVVDNIMVGRLGKVELAAVALANAVFIALVVLGMGLSFALPPLIAEAIGKNNHKETSKFFKHSFIINIVFAIFVIFLIEAIIPFMDTWKQDPIVLEQAIIYLRISCYSLIPFMIFQTFRCFSDGFSSTTPPMIAMLVGNVANVFLNYLLIYGKFGAPQLGLAGAAWGTFISRVITMILLMLILAYTKKTIWQDIINANFRKYDLNIFKRLYKLGIPTSLQGFFEVSAFGLASIFAGIISIEAQAAHQISINLASISFLICSGIAMASTIRVGNSLGEQDAYGVRRAGFSAIIMTAFFMTLTSLIYVTFRYQLPELYNNDKTVIDIAASMLIVASIFQIPDGIQVSAIGALRGMQDVLLPSIYTFVAYWVLSIPLSYYLAFNTSLGVNGIWIALTIGLTCSAILMTIRFHRKTKKRILAEL